VPELFEKPDAVPLSNTAFQLKVVLGTLLVRVMPVGLPVHISFGGPGEKFTITEGLTITSTTVCGPGHKFAVATIIYLTVAGAMVFPVPEALKVVLLPDCNTAVHE
jgi:hypothetical protein